MKYVLLWILWRAAKINSIAYRSVNGRDVRTHHIQQEASASEAVNVTNEMHTSR